MYSGAGLVCTSSPRLAVDVVFKSYSFAEVFVCGSFRSEVKFESHRFFEFHKHELRETQHDNDNDNDNKYSHLHKNNKDNDNDNDNEPVHLRIVDFVIGAVCESKHCEVELRFVQQKPRVDVKLIVQPFKHLIAPSTDRTSSGVAAGVHAKVDLVYQRH